jgi:prefoldin subunit 5
MNNKDVATMQQNLKSLKTSCATSLEKIKTISDYKGDELLKTVYTDNLNFLKDEADSKFQLFIDYYLLADNFTKLQTAFENKSKSDRTNKDVKEFNAVVLSYNKSINELNRVNNKLNNDRTRLTERMEDAILRFRKRHTPVYKDK